MYKVEKKDKSQENFDRNKIIAGIIAAGGSMEDAEQVATGIEAVLPSLAVNNVIKSEDIRDKGLEIFRQVNPVAADKFETYQKPETN